MRYVFLVLIVYILFRLIRQSIKEYGAIRDAKKSIKGISPGYLLVTMPEEIKGKHYELRKETIIGRAARCDVVLHTKFASPIHAAIYEKKEKVFISDYGTKYGVYVNGERIGIKDKLLDTGDYIQIGDVSLEVNLYGEEDPIE